MAENGNGNGAGQNIGRVEQVTGVVVDAVFPEGLPEIYSAIVIETSGVGAEDRVDNHSGYLLDATDVLLACSVAVLSHFDLNPFPWSSKVCWSVGV